MARQKSRFVEANAVSTPSVGRHGHIHLLRLCNANQTMRDRLIEENIIRPAMLRKLPHEVDPKFFCVFGDEHRIYFVTGQQHTQ